MSTGSLPAPSVGERRFDHGFRALSRRDRQLAIGALCLGSAVAWVYLGLGFRSGMPVHGAASSMSGMSSMSPMSSSWTAGETGVQLLMWAVMMVAMMLPATIPATLVYIAVGRKADRQGQSIAPASSLVAGYVSVWLAFSVAATAAQWGLERLNLLSPSMASNDGRFGGAVLVAAGLYQLTPLKAVCLKRCRDPARLIADHWRSGSGGALRMGADLGLYCLGCCWVLMALVFVGGVMNLLWVGAIATLILLEKLAPRTQAWGRALGAAMVVAGVVVALR